MLRFVSNNPTEKFFMKEKILPNFSFIKMIFSLILVKIQTVFSTYHLLLPKPTLTSLPTQFLDFFFPASIEFSLCFLATIGNESALEYGQPTTDPVIEES